MSATQSWFGPDPANLRSTRSGAGRANTLKRRRPKPGDKCHLDEVSLRIRGKQYYLWRAIDQNGHVLEILVQGRRNAIAQRSPGGMSARLTGAARRFCRKLLRGLQYVPRVIVTDKLKSYAAAKRTILPHVEHRQSNYLNSCIEVSHHPPPAFQPLSPPKPWPASPTQRRERQIRRSNQPATPPAAFHLSRRRNLCCLRPVLLVQPRRIHNHFQLRRDRLTATQHRAARDAAFEVWRDVTGTAATQ